MMKMIMMLLFLLLILTLFFGTVSKTPRPREGLTLILPPPPPVPGPVSAEVRIMEEERRSPQRPAAQQEQDINETASSPVHTPRVSRAGSATLRSGEQRDSLTQSNQNPIIIRAEKFILILVCSFFLPQPLCFYF